MRLWGRLPAASQRRRVRPDPIPTDRLRQRGVNDSPDPVHRPGRESGPRKIRKETIDLDRRHRTNGDRTHSGQQMALYQRPRIRHGGCRPTVPFAPSHTSINVANDDAAPIARPVAATETSSRNPRDASRRLPHTVRLTYRSRPVRASTPAYARNSHEPIARSRIDPDG